MKRQGDVLLAMAFLILLAVAVLTAGVPFGSWGASQAGRTIVVPGEATVQMDVLGVRIDISVTAEGESYAVAQQVSADRQKQANDILGRFGASDATILRSEVGNYDSFTWVTSHVSIWATVDSEEKAVGAADRLNKLAGVQVVSMQPLPRDLEKARAAAMKAAVADARIHAAEAAKAAGLRAGRIRSVEVISIDDMAQSRQLQVNVQVTFEIQ